MKCGCQDSGLQLFEGAKAGQKAKPPTIHSWPTKLVKPNHFYETNGHQTWSCCELYRRSSETFLELNHQIYQKLAPFARTKFLMNPGTGHQKINVGTHDSSEFWGPNFWWILVLVIKTMPAHRIHQKLAPFARTKFLMNLTKDHQKISAGTQETSEPATMLTHWCLASPHNFWWSLVRFIRNLVWAKGANFWWMLCVNTEFLMTGTRIHQKFGPGKAGQFLMNLVFQLSKKFRRPAVQFTAIMCKNIVFPIMWWPFVS